MVDKNALRAEIVRNGFTQKEVAKAIGMSEKTFIFKVKNSTFGIDDVEKLIVLLSINDPMAIFFAK